MDFGQSMEVEIWSGKICSVNKWNAASIWRRRLIDNITWRAVYQYWSLEVHTSADLSVPINTIKVFRWRLL